MQAINLPNVPASVRWQFARRCPRRTCPSRARQFAHRCPHRAWPLQVRQFARTCPRRMRQHLPDVTLAVRADNLPVDALGVCAGNLPDVALAKRAGNSPAVAFTVRGKCHKALHICLPPMFLADCCVASCCAAALRHLLSPHASTLDPPPLCLRRLFLANLALIASCCTLCWLIVALPHKGACAAAVAAKALAQCRKALRVCLPPVPRRWVLAECHEATFAICSDGDVLSNDVQCSTAQGGIVCNLVASYRDDWDHVDVFGVNKIPIILIFAMCRSLAVPG